MFERLKLLRNDKDLDQKDLADFLGVVQQTYSRYESGEISITAEAIVKLSKFYGVSTDYLLGLTNNPKRNY